MDQGPSYIDPLIWHHMRSASAMKFAEEILNQLKTEVLKSYRKELDESSRQVRDLLHKKYYTNEGVHLFHQLHNIMLAINKHKINPDDKEVFIASIIAMQSTEGMVNDVTMRKLANDILSALGLLDCSTNKDVLFSRVEAEIGVIQATDTDVHLSEGKVVLPRYKKSATKILEGLIEQFKFLKQHNTYHVKKP